MDVKVEELLKGKGVDVWSVGPEATVLEALELMAEKNIGAVLVTEGERLAGIFSERDYARKVALAGKSSRDTLVKELMSTEIISVDTQKSVQDCLALFTEHRIRHLPVVEDDQLVGILTIGDVVKHIISHLELTVRELENYISGSGYGG
ncbi:MAG: CBS domain-containing protein [Spirochaetia bacterium]